MKKANLNFKAKVGTNLASFFRILFNYFSKVKDILYIIKKIISLQIIYNRNVMI